MSGGKRSPAMTLLIGLSASLRCLCMRRRPLHSTNPAIITLVAVVACFSSVVTNVSGFSLKELNGQHEHNWSKIREGSSSVEWKRMRRNTMLKVETGGRDDNIFTALELEDSPSSRRRALASLAVSTAAIFALPQTTLAIEKNTGGNDSLRMETQDRNLENIKSAETQLSSEPSSFQESVSGFVAGATLAATKTIVKFPLDTATVRVQLPNSNYSIRDPLGLFQGSFNGISLTLLSNIPAGAVFFGVKDAVKSAIKNSGDVNASTMPRWLSTSLAVGIAMIPYWLVRNPSEVVKVRQQANIDGYGGDVSAIDAVKQTIQGSDKYDGEEGIISEFYTGYWENVFYAFPADVIKFVAYDYITEGRKNLSPFEGARAGALATALAQLVSTPLDVTRNRLMTGKTRKYESQSGDDKKMGYIENLISLGKEEGLSGLFAGTAPRVGKAVLSGAIQFATYEETKQAFAKSLRRN